LVKYSLSTKVQIWLDSSAKQYNCGFGLRMSNFSIHPKEKEETLSKVMVKSAIFYFGLIMFIVE